MNYGMRALVVIVLACAGSWHEAHATTWTVDCSAGTISNGVTTVASGLNASNALGSLLGTPLGPGMVTPGPVANDTILINSLCTQDVTIRTSGLTLANPSGASATLNTGDGIAGQLELAGAAMTVIDGLSLGPTGTASGEVADLYVHDGSALALKESQVVNSPIIGIDVARSSSVALTDTTVTGNGASSSTASQTGMGILVENSSTLMLGNTSGTKPAMIENNAGSGVVAQDASSVVVYAATISGNQLTQLTLLGTSSGFMTGLTATPGGPAPTTAIAAPTGGCCAAIFASGASTLDLEQGVVVTGSSTQSAISLEGSSLLANTALISSGAGASSPASSQPTITGSGNAVIALAGGNSICFGTLSIATPPSCTAGGGYAIEILHVATLVQVDAAVLGFPAQADSITGGGTIQLQSTVDLGVEISGTATPSLTWNVGNGGIVVEQNSSFRLEGGVIITGVLDLNEGSNAFFNHTVNPLANTVSNGGASSSIICPFIAVAASHVFIAGANPAASLTPLPSLATTFSTGSPAAGSKQCLAF
jgi:hypothetical protein